MKNYPQEIKDHAFTLYRNQFLSTGTTNLSKIAKALKEKFPKYKSINHKTVTRWRDGEDWNRRIRNETQNADANYRNDPTPKSIRPDYDKAITFFVKNRTILENLSLLTYNKLIEILQDENANPSFTALASLFSSLQISLTNTDKVMGMDILLAKEINNPEDKLKDNLSRMSPETKEKLFEKFPNLRKIV